MNIFNLFFQNLFFFVNTSFHAFQMPTFFTFLNTRLESGGGHTIKQLSGHHQTSARPWIGELARTTRGLEL